MRYFTDDHDMFTRGGCHILAQAINARKGWPIYGMDCYFGPDDHVFVLMDNGDCLDIDGISTREEMCVRWGHDDIAAFPDDYDFDDDGWNDDIPVTECELRAEELADELIAKAVLNG
jgi:hypothetical protein